MMTPQDELTARQLAEARARAQGRNLRRFLVLLAAGFVLIAVGARGQDATLAYFAGGFLIVAAIVILLRGDRT